MSASLPDLSIMNPKTVASARRMIHNACLWPARMAHSYLATPTARDANGQHMQLSWIAERRALSSKPAETGLALDLKPATLHLQFTEAGKPVAHIFHMDDRSSAETEAWILVELLHRGVDRTRFSKTLPFELTNPMSGDSEKYDTLDHEAELAALGAWLTSAATILEGISKGKNSSDGVYFSPAKSQLATKTGDTEIAFSLGDDRGAEPSFTATPKSQGTVQSLRPARTLTASQIVRDQMSERDISAFLTGAVATPT